MATGGEQPLLQISQRQPHSHPPFGMVSRVQVTVQLSETGAPLAEQKYNQASLVSLTTHPGSSFKLNTATYVMLFTQQKGTALVIPTYLKI